MHVWGRNLLVIVIDQCIKYWQLEELWKSACVLYSLTRQQQLYSCYYRPFGAHHFGKNVQHQLENLTRYDKSFKQKRKPFKMDAVFLILVCMSVFDQCIVVGLCLKRCWGSDEQPNISRFYHYTCVTSKSTFTLKTRRIMLDILINLC